MKDLHRSLAFPIILLYVGLSGLWFVLTHSLASQLWSRSPEALVPALVSDGVFLLTSALLLYGAFKITRRWHTRTEAELRRVHRALKTLSACNQILVRATDEATLLQELCQSLVQTGGYRLAWVGFAEQSGGEKRVRPAAQAGYDDGYLESVRITWDESEWGRSPVGTAIRTGQVAIARNIRTDPDFAPWCDDALRRGYASSIALPLALPGQSSEHPAREPALRGMLAIYAQEPDAFDEAEIDLLKELASDLTYGIVALRTRDEHRRIESRLANILEIAVNAMIAVDAHHRVLLFNPAAELTFGYHRHEMDGKPFDMLLMPSSVDTYYAYAQEVVGLTRAQRSGAYCEVLACRRGGRPFPAELSLAASQQNEDPTFTIILRDITDRKQAEDELIASRDRIQTVLERITDAFFSLDTAWRFVYANREAERLLRKSRDELLGQNVWEVFPEAVETDFYRQYHRAMEQQVSTTAEDYYKPMATWFEAHAYPSPDGLSVYFRDITERKQAEQELRRVNRALRTLSECNQVLVRATDEASLLHQICQGIVQTGGYLLAWVGFAEPDSERRVRPVAQAGDPNGYVESLFITWSDTEWGQGPTGKAVRTGQTQVVRHIQTDPNYHLWRENALRRGFVSSIALPLVCPDREGSDRGGDQDQDREDTGDISVLGALNIYAHEPDAFDEAEIDLLKELASDLVYGIVALRVRDEHRRAEAQLRYQKTLLECQNEAAIDGILVTSSAREWLSFNRRFVEMWGLSDEVVAMRNLQAALESVLSNVTDADAFQEKIRMLYENPHQTSWDEIVLRDGRVFERYTAPVADAGGKYYGRVWFHRDVSESRRLLQEVRVAHERLQSLSRRLVEVQEAERRHIARELHDEIGQSLTGLHLLLEMTSRLPTPETVGKNVQEARTLVNELIAQVREMSLNLRPAMLDDLGLLPTLRWFFQRYTTQTDIRVHFRHTGMEQRFASEVETVVYRLVQEALTNVARYAGVDEVTVRLWSDQDTIGLQVEDEGKGFDPEMAFAQATSSGLAGMRERVMLLGGDLVIESSPGSGTCVAAELPLGG
ncbi:MAG: PAS domain S-box protein [Chloroflexaceae bacterium]|nr:PAS domain S-box protein [Chloroflexaceae bacterium]